MGRMSDIPVRVAVQSGGWTVCGPSSVCNTGVRIKDLCQIRLLLFDELLELGHLADLLECKDLLLLVTIDCQTS